MSLGYLALITLFQITIQKNGYSSIHSFLWDNNLKLFITQLFRADRTGALALTRSLPVLQ